MGCISFGELMDTHPQSYRQINICVRIAKKNFIGCDCGFSCADCSQKCGHSKQVKSGHIELSCDQCGISSDKEIGSKWLTNRPLNKDFCSSCRLTQSAATCTPYSEVQEMVSFSKRTGFGSRLDWIPIYQEFQQDDELDLDMILYNANPQAQLYGRFALKEVCSDLSCEYILLSEKYTIETLGKELDYKSIQSLLRVSK